jgi:hypothetical protein
MEEGFQVIPCGGREVPREVAPLQAPLPYALR